MGRPNEWIANLGWSRPVWSRLGWSVGGAVAAAAAAAVVVGLGVWGVSVVWTGGVWTVSFGEDGETVVLLVLVVVLESNLGGCVAGGYEVEMTDVMALV